MLTRSSVSIFRPLFFVGTCALAFAGAHAQSLEPVIDPKTVTPDKLNSLAMMAAGADGVRKIALLYRLGSSYYVKQDYANAARVFKEITQVGPKDDANVQNAQVLLAQSYARLKDFKSANSALKPVIDQKGNSQRKDIALAQSAAYEREGSGKSIPAETLAKLTAKEPSFEDISLFRQLVLDAAKSNPKEAVSACDAWLDKHKLNEFAPLIALDRYRIQLGDSPETVKALKAILESYPAKSSCRLHVLFELCSTLLRDGKPEDIEASFDEFLAGEREYPKNKFYDANLGLSIQKYKIMNRLAMGMPKESLSMANEFISKYPDSLQAADLRDWIKNNDLNRFSQGTYSSIAIIAIMVALVLGVAGAIRYRFKRLK